MASMKKCFGERFWGHLCLKFPNELNSRCYPISANTATEVRNQLLLGRSDSGWMIVTTLNNRVLAFNPKQMQRVRLLDDGSEGPENDFQLEDGLDDYAGLPIETYRMLAAWADEPNEFGHSRSASEQMNALELIEQGGFTSRPSALAALLRQTVVHYVNGDSERYEAKRGNLAELLEIEDDADIEIVELSASEDEFENYLPLNMLRLIDISSIELELAQSEVAA